MNSNRRRLTLAAVGLLALGLGAPPLRAENAAPAGAPTVATRAVSVFAAASLKNALDEAAAVWTAKTGVNVALSYAASFPLAKQIEAGAPADIFISADLASMDYLSQRNLIAPASRANFLGNSLVIVAPKDAGFDRVELTRAGIAARLGGGRIAAGDPASVPAGRYAKAALEKLGLWTDLEPHFAFADNVRGALLFVSRQEAPLGIVYATDAQADASVKIVGRFPADSHPPIVYPIALTAASQSAEAQAFLTFLRSAEAAPFFAKQGFTVAATH